MTNSPTYDQQLALNAYWETIGGQTFPPGTNRAERDPQRIRARGDRDPGQPNIAATQWRTMSGQKNLVYYFESAFSPSLFRVKLKSLNFAAGSPARKLSLTENSALFVDGRFVSGEVTRHFRAASPFAFAGVKD